MSQPGRTLLVCAALLLLGSPALAVGRRAARSQARTGTSALPANPRRPHPRALLARARARVSRMAHTSTQVQRWLRDARARRHQRRARCLDRLLSQVHASERMARDELRHFAAARQRNGERAPHAARIATIAGRAAELRAEAAACGHPRGRYQPLLPTGYRVRVIKPALPRY